MHIEDDDNDNYARKLKILAEFQANSRGREAERIEVILAQIAIMPEEKQLEPGIQKLKRMAEEYLERFDRTKEMEAELAERERYQKMLEKARKERGLPPIRKEDVIEELKALAEDGRMPAHIVSKAIKNLKREAKKEKKRKERMYKL